MRIRQQVLTMAVLLTGVILGQGSIKADVLYPLDVPAQLSPKAEFSRLTGVAHTPDGVSIAVGPRGHILSSDDSREWNQREVPVSSDLVAVQFPSSRVGWAVGHDGVVLKTEDGGRSWSIKLDGRTYGDILVDYYEARIVDGDEQLEYALNEARRFRDEGASKPFLGVWFKNEQEGWVVGQFNLILKTVDGGETWEPWIHRTDNGMAYTLFSIQGIGNDVFIVGELGLLLKLDSVSGRFEKIETPYPGTFFGIAGHENFLVAYGLRGSAFASRDEGENWHRLQTGLSSGVVDGSILNDGSLVLASASGYVVRSTDGGETFKQIMYPERMAIGSLTQVGPNELLIVGDQGTRVISIQ